MFPGPRLAWACALAGVALLWVGTLGATPPHVDLAEVAAHDGMLVEVEGRVTAARPRGDSTWVEIGDGNHRLEVLVDGAAWEVSRGDRVRLVGSIYAGGGRFLLAADARDAQVLARASDVVLRPAELSEDPVRYLDTFVRVEGTLLRERGAWWLRDEWTNRAVEVELPEAAEEGPGEAWGRLRYAPQRAAYILDASSWTPQDGGHQ